MDWHQTGLPVHRGRRQGIEQGIFGADIPIQRCQVHKARNIIDRLAPKDHGPVRRTFKQAREMDDAEKAERIIRNLARSFEAPNVARSILEGVDEILTVVRLIVIRLGLPLELRRSLASTNIIGSMNTVSDNSAGT